MFNEEMEVRDMKIWDSGWRSGMVFGILIGVALSGIICAVAIDILAT